jgi:prephenate dehydrogenase
MDRHEYRRQCIEICKSAILEAEDFPNGPNLEQLLDMHVDSHEYVTGVQSALHVLLLTKFANAYFEYRSARLETQDFPSTVYRLAGCAMRADVDDCMGLAHRELARAQGSRT